MKIQPTSANVPDSIVRTAEIEDGPDIEITGMVHRGKMFRAQRVRITYRPAGGRWTCSNVLVAGGILKKDGNPGLGEGSQEYNVSESATGTPGWVRAVAVHLRPLQPAPDVQTAVLDIQILN